LKEKLKKFYEDNRDKIVVSSVAIAAIAAAAAIYYKRVGDGRNLCCVKLWTNETHDRALVKVFQKNDKETLFKLRRDLVK
jgi:hypothetical protein